MSATGRDRRRNRAIAREAAPLEPWCCAMRCSPGFRRSSRRPASSVSSSTPRPEPGPPRTRTLRHGRGPAGPGQPRLDPALGRGRGRSTERAALEELRCRPGRRACCAPRMGAHFLLRIHEGVDLVAAARAYRGHGSSRRRQRAPRTLLRGRPARRRRARLRQRRRRDLGALLARGARRWSRYPMPGQAESLNVAAAAAVCLFERVRQLRQTVSGARARSPQYCPRSSKCAAAASPRAGSSSRAPRPTCWWRRGRGCLPGASAPRPRALRTRSSRASRTCCPGRRSLRICCRRSGLMVRP